MRELVRFLYLVVVVLPLGLLLIGPLLTLAALRGRQRIGPIIFNPGRRGMAARIGALLLGLLAWLIVWAGLAVILSWVGQAANRAMYSPVLQPYVTPGVPQVEAPSTPTLLPSATPQTPAVSTPTQPPSEAAPAPSPSPLPSPSPTQSPLPPMPASVPPTPTPAPVPPTSTPPPTPTPTPVPPSPTLPPTPTFTPSPTPVATLSPQEMNEAIAAVEAANDLLRTAVIEPSIGNLAALETLWRGEALAKAQAFAQDLYQRYLRPLDVTFVYLLPPLVRGGNTSDIAFVTSAEEWTYTGPRASHSERFQFIYTLRREDEGWVISDYAYGDAPSALPSFGGKTQTPIPTPMTITATSVITPANQ